MPRTHPKEALRNKRRYEQRMRYRAVVRDLSAKGVAPAKAKAEPKSEG